MVETHCKAGVQYDQRWHDAWQTGVPPGQKWDVGKPTVAFSQFLDGGFLATQGKVAYVPGCGRGYDVVELAKRGCSATGLDLAPESVEEANKHLQSQQTASISGAAQFVSGDYFTYRTDTPWVDIGFDHTFMCALHPSLRRDWARTWAKVIKPGSHLVTLEYPIRPDDKTGPPWAVSPQIYSDLLIPSGFKNVHFKEVEMASMSHPRQGGAEVLACWQKV